MRDRQTDGQTDVITYTESDMMKMIWPKFKFLNSQEADNRQLEHRNIAIYLSIWDSMKYIVC